MPLNVHSEDGARPNFDQNVTLMQISADDLLCVANFLIYCASSSSRKLSLLVKVNDSPFVSYCLFFYILILWFKP